MTSEDWSSDTHANKQSPSGALDRITSRQRDILIGSGIVFLISLGVVIPALGVLIGWIFTLGGGFAGGATVGYLRRKGGRDGAKYGLLVAIIGGIPSSIIGVIVGTFLNIAVLSSQGNPSNDTTGWIIIAIFGLISGIILKLIGGIVGGGLIGWFFDQEAHE
ncbi:DUF5518 domain-containing protein [Halogeometricum sp. S1BR25-6]|uniref:DUF5518 domain-containing protein n=1 Tax=Halogeometricum salsisoli TaxID=2950536 RepID=A0ABU2GEY6_9EURY|nr:DUF5518 domain-containing protein [Halogeometricum sp. S1BR25-6]MDS0299371.1 DUF5518 domain-containing protein [Halogeometricum sp. S1BR25-6]